MQKTAGTALWRRLQHHFGSASIYPGPGDGEPPDVVLSVDNLLRRWAIRRGEIRMVAGHFPLATLDLLDAPFTTMTLLRDPVERTLSALRDLQQRSPELRGAPLEEIFDDTVRAPLLRNHMVRLLALTVEEMDDGALTAIDVTDVHLQRARERLRQIDVVGLQERFEPFCAELAVRFGWDLGPPVTMNRTSPVRVPAGLRERIAASNGLDIELYEIARAERF
jgi:hypothetical protein